MIPEIKGEANIPMKKNLPYDNGDSEAIPAM